MSGVHGFEPCAIHLSMLEDLRHAVRALTRAPGTAAVLLLSLALGAGVNASVYGVLDALLLRGPASVRDPSRLVNIYTSEFSAAPFGPSSYPDYLSVKSGASTIAAAAAFDDSTEENVGVGESSQSARIGRVSDGFFNLLQLDVHAGRVMALDDVSGSREEAVVSFALAKQLGGADAVLGKTLTLGENLYSIVGVAPARFRGLRAGRECDVWIPMRAVDARRGDRRLWMVARLAPDATVEEADAELGRMSDALARDHPDTNRGRIGQPDSPRRLKAVRYSQLDPGASRQVLLIGLVIGGASVLLLGSACLNLGSLLLSRAAARRHEFAVKMALGAARRRLVRQLFLEACCLSLAGGMLGLLFAIWTAGAIPALFMAEQAALLDTRLDPRVMLMTVAVSCLAAACFGIAPAFQGTAATAVTALRADAGGVSVQHGGARLRALLVGGQVALSAVLLLAAGLLVQSLTRALEGDLAATVRRVAFATMEMPGRFGDPVRGIAYRNRVFQRVAGVHGVAAVGWANTLPLARGNTRQFQIGGDTAAVVDTVFLETNVVSAGYFSVMALPCIEGRLFEARDSPLAPAVVVVDELLARRYFGASATGRHLTDQNGTEMEIVGVVRSGTFRTLQQAPQPTVYYPSTQEYLWRGYLLVRTAGDPEISLPAVRATIEATGETDTILWMSTLDTYLKESLALDRLTTTLVGVWGLAALAMATIGVYGVMADTVQRQTREIGLRVALGAGRAQVVRLVFMKAAYIAVAGLLAGGAAAYAITRLAQSIVDGIPSLDIATFGAAFAALMIAVVVAAILPLHRALRVNPNIALRAE
jgi:putative ABC transport system permease protein